MKTVYDCGIITMGQHHSDRKGNLTVAENGVTLPFDVKRIFYLYDVPAGENRGSHAHRNISQLIIAASGSFSVTVDDGATRRTFFLNRPYQGLYIPEGIWSWLDDFSSGAVCMVLASGYYDEGEYLRNYSDFKEYRNQLR